MTTKEQIDAIAEVMSGVYQNRYGNWYWSDDSTAFDPFNDLNDMHRVEKILSKEEDPTIRARNQFNLYVWNLYDVCTGHAWEHDTNDYPGDVMCATAAQRAEAFLKTIDKWTD